MWSKEVSIKTKASKAQIWNLWTDVSNWKTWDNQVIESELSGNFMVGEKGELQPKGGPKSKFELVEVTHQKSFTSRSSLPFTKMDFIHLLEEIDDELILTHKIEMSGLLTFLFSKVIGNKVIQELPAALNKLDNLAQTKQL